MRERLTSLLDALGLLLVAAGSGAAAGTVIGWAGLAVSGVVVLAGSAAAARWGGGSG
ncbi:hypothetical protein ABZ208_35410 [Streptomyces sp. NPDC006208]|uniref:hypothetical protein n=1 Tax=Streptomyces sp. NPDC006208 TaxID=3156734 RepID=UPI0033AC7DD2